MKKLILKVVTIIAVVAIYITTVSCSSGWSCKKRYVDTTPTSVQQPSKPC